MPVVPMSTTVTTVLTPIERVRVDVAAQGTYSTLHRTSVDDVVDDLRKQRAEAVLVSVSRYDSSSTARMAAMVREFPRVPTFALLSDVHKSTPQSVHVLGQIGVRTLIDVRQPSGWSMLRERLMEEQANDVQRLALGALNLDLASAPLDCWQFFELLFTHRPHIVSIRQIGRCMNVLPATLVSRFYRAHLPSPKRYIDLGRLIRAARLFENIGLSITAVAKQLDYSSPQAFSRHVRCMCGVSPVKFRQMFNGETMLQRFREELVLPYIDVLRTFRPVITDPSWVSKTNVAPSGQLSPLL
jgi:AraC-like DNA-binding protein